MRTITTTTGAAITLDGDLLAVMEALYREVTARRALDGTFDDMMKDPKFLAEAERRKLGVDPMGGEELAAIVADVMRQPPDVVARMMEVTKPPL